MRPGAASGQKYEIEGKGLRECGFTELGQKIIVILLVTSV